jgi:very-short-patch-repair endonuclease
LEPAQVLSRLGGRATTADLLERTTRHLVRKAVAEGSVVRAARGDYVLPGLPAPEQAAARAHGVLSHTSAAAWWGLGLVLEPTEVHVTVPHGSRPAVQDAVRVHRTTRLERQGPVTPVLRTVLDCATLLPFPEALAVADGALRSRFIGPRELLSAAEASHGPGRARRLRVARHADGRADNPFESCLRGVVLDSGTTGFVPQLEIRTAAAVVHVDLGDPERRIAIEADSFAHHGGRADLARDCRRYDELVADVWRVLRFAWEHVMFERDWVARIVREVCAVGRPPLVRYRRDGAD